MLFRIISKLNQKRTNFLFLLTFLVSSSLKANSLNDLEVEVLTQYEDFLPQIESKVILEVQKNPSSAFVHYLLSYLYLRIYSQDPQRNASYAQRSIDLANQAQELAPNEEFGHLALSDAYRTRGLTEKAWLELRKTSSRSWRVLYRVIKNQYEQIEARLASKSLENFIISEADSRDILIPLLLTVYKNLDTEEAFEKLQTLNTQVLHPLLLQELALHFLSNGHLKKAKKLLSSLTKNSIDRYPEIAFNYGILLYSEFKEKDKALEVLSKSLRSEMLPTVLQAQNHSYLSLIYLDRNDHENFFKHLFLALDRSSNQLEVLSTVASMLLKKGDPESVSWMMDTVNERYPGRAEFHALLGTLYSENFGMHNKAIASFENAALLEPDNSSYYDSIGLSYYRLKRFEEAIAFFNRAISIDPTDSTAFYSQACIFSLQGMHSLALRSLKQAIDINPSLQADAIKDENFQKLREFPVFKIITEGSSKSNGQFEKLNVLND